MKIMPFSKFREHETKSHSLIRYLCVLGVVVAYFLFVSYKFGAGNGLLITFLTWSFFLFCTPIADAGFLLDFPIRLLTGIRMIHSEAGVWIFGISLNIFSWFTFPGIYERTIILKLLSHILTNPFPYWSIIFLSCLGTFLSVYFGDELIDVAKHKEREKYHRHLRKYQLIFFAFLIISIITLYNFLLNELGVHIPLF